MSPKYPNPSDLTFFYKDSTLHWEEDGTCEFYGRDLEEGVRTINLHCRRCEPDMFSPEE